MGKKAKRFKRHSHRHQRMWASQNLLPNRDEPTARNQVWIDNITFIRVGKQWNYLGIVIDRHSREIIGWPFDKSRSAKLVRESLLIAMQDNPLEIDLICHSDQEFEYASRLYMNTLGVNGIHISMSRKGHCWNNPHMESFFQSLKTEIVYFNHFRTLEQATAYIMDYIRFYNQERLHSSLGYHTQANYERMAA